MIFLIYFFIAIINFFHTNVNGYQDIGGNVTKILNAFFGGYDKRVRPNYGGPPVVVEITMFITSISSVSEVQMDFTSDFYFRQVWRDPRLSFESLPAIHNLVVGAEVADRIWVPDTFFANEKSAYFHRATTPNTFLRISSSGEVIRSIRLTVTASCPMDLRYFPMDRQRCNIEIESYGYSIKDIIYRWRSREPDPVGIQPGLELPQFRIVGYRKSQRDISLTTGNYSRLVCEIQFARSMGYYLIQIYIPASLIVIISWVSFWLHRNATPARVALGVTTVLTMTTLMSSTNAALPKISYIKSIDVYLGTCFVMVFASLVEYATVGYLGKRIAMRKSRAIFLSRLTEQHRAKCTAAAAAAAAASGTGVGCGGGHVHHIIPAHIPSAATSTLVTDPTTGNMVASGQTYPGVNGLGLRPDIMAERANLSIPSFGFDNILTREAETMESHYKPMTRDRSPTSAHRNDGVYPSNVKSTRSNSGTCQSDHCNHSHSQNNNGPSFWSSHVDSDIYFTGLPALPVTSRDLDKTLGISPSDIDKYSRVVFPVCFVCFNLMYWIIYLHISNVLVTEADLNHISGMA